MFINASRAAILRHAATHIALLSSCSALALRAQTVTARKTSALERTVDATIKPGDDFFAYANGGWLKATRIPEGKERWSVRDEINEQTRHRITQLLDEARNAPAGTLARKVADFRAAWLNEATIEARGRAPLQAQLDSIDAIADKRA